MKSVFVSSLARRGAMQATSRGARQLIAPAPRRPSSLVHAPIPAPLLRFSPEYLNPLIFKRFSVVEAKRKASTAATVNLAESLGSTGNVVTSENEAAAAAVPAKKPGKIRQFINKYGWLGVGIYTVAYLGGMPAFYALISTGVLPIDGAVLYDVLSNIGVANLMGLTKETLTGAGATWAIAIAMNEMFELLRIPIVMWVVVNLRKHLDARNLKKDAPQ